MKLKSFLSVQSKLRDYAQLMRLDKPIGILLLLWPTLMALWIASAGKPPLPILLIFVMGTVTMRSAGCVLNDWADRDFDRYVARTRERPLTAGRVQSIEALSLVLSLLFFSASLIVSLNLLTKQLAIVALVLAATYPFTKRFFALPQAYLGIAFGFGIPMAFAAVLNAVPWLAWVLLLGNIFWAVAYDTAYAMVDREDDIKIGMRTSAITFGRFDITAIMMCYVMFLSIMAYVGAQLNFRWPYWLCWGVAWVCVMYHLVLLCRRTRESYFAVFLHNNYLGASMFVGVVLAYAF